MIVPVDVGGGLQELRLVTRGGDGFVEEQLDQVRFVPFVGAVRERALSADKIPHGG